MVFYKGVLVEYKHHRDWCIGDRRQYYSKWTRLFKWDDGTWRYGLIIGKYRDSILIELTEGGIFTVDKGIIYPCKKGFKNKKWRNNGEDLSAQQELKHHINGIMMEREI